MDLQLAMNTPIKHYLAALDIPNPLTGLERVNYMIAKHQSLFAFSSVNVVLERDLPLDIESIVDRLVTKRQGGYCFEHNKLMQLALEELGYEVRPILARVLLDGNEFNRRSHRFTLLTINSKQYVVDVGFGVDTPREALALENQTYTWHQNQVRVVVQQEQHYRIEQWYEENWRTLYRFDLSETTESDCDASHFVTHKFPQSNFVNNLVVSNIAAKSRNLVRRLEYFAYNDQNGSEEQLVITSAELLYQILTEKMQLILTKEDAEHLFVHQTERAIKG